MSSRKEEISVVTTSNKTLIVSEEIKKTVCSDIGLETLILNDGIGYVDRSYNKLTELIMPGSATHLDCSSNQSHLL
ncbi:MAG: hypothetical protein COA94_02780 [Rickettsiales bacterium]|nr:MAG: hypothetical protein COA94_02780 [Rickettsiales bacterium]